MHENVLPPWHQRLRSQFFYYLPTMLIAVGVITGWELAVVAFDIKEFLLPKPSVVFGEFRAELDLFLKPGQRSLLFEATKATARAALGGFMVGSVAGMLVALVTARWAALREAVLPFAIAANSVPIIAFAPIMNNWFGITSIASKVAIVSVIVFFPVMINTARGLIEIDPRQLELLESYAARSRKVLFALRIPNALPYTFSALRVASALAVIGAVVGEFFGGPRATLGVFITQEAATFDFARAWSAVMMASLIGIVFYTGVQIAERLIIPWYTRFYEN